MAGWQQLAANNSLTDVKVKARCRHTIRYALSVAACGPSLGLLTLIVTLGLGEPWNVEARQKGFLLLIMIPGMVLVSATIWADCHASSRLSELAAANVRSLLCASLFSGLIALCVSVLSDSVTGRGGDAGGIVLFVCVPTLLICGAMLWLAVRCARSAWSRTFILLGFTLATVLLEMWIQSQRGNRWEDLLITSHSMLVALAAGICLCAWSRWTFRESVLEEGA